MFTMLSLSVIHPFLWLNNFFPGYKWTQVLHTGIEVIKQKAKQKQKLSYLFS